MSMQRTVYHSYMHVVVVWFIFQRRVFDQFLHILPGVKLDALETVETGFKRFNPHSLDFQLPNEAPVRNKIGWKKQMNG